MSVFLAGDSCWTQSSGKLKMQHVPKIRRAGTSKSKFWLGFQFCLDIREENEVKCTISPPADKDAGMHTIVGNSILQWRASQPPSLGTHLWVVLELSQNIHNTHSTYFRPKRFVVKHKVTAFKLRLWGPLSNLRPSKLRNTEFRWTQTSSGTAYGAVHRPVLVYLICIPCRSSAVNSPSYLNLSQNKCRFTVHVLPVWSSRKVILLQWSGSNAIGVQ